MRLIGNTVSGANRGNILKGAAFGLSAVLGLMACASDGLTDTQKADKKVALQEKSEDANGRVLEA